MLINFIWLYSRYESPENGITFWIELDGDENLKRLLQAFPDEMMANNNIIINPLPFHITSPDNSSFIKKIFRLYTKLFRHTNYFRNLGIKSVIILGGDDISEYYKGWMIVSDLYRIFRYSKYFRTILVGQTIGPFSGIRRYLAHKWLTGSIIFTRDTLTTTYLKEVLKLPSDLIHESADLSFPDLPLKEMTGCLPSKINIKPGEYLTLVPGGFYLLYTRDKEQYLNAWGCVIERLLTEDRFSRLKLVLLPHVTRPEDDRMIIRQLVQKFEQTLKYRDRIIPVQDELLPHQLRSILGEGLFTISSRMHAALSSFQMKKPAIALGYSLKYKAVVGDSVQCPDLVVDCTAQLLKKPEIFAEEVMKSVNYLFDNYTQLETHLKTRIPELQETVKKQMIAITRLTET